MALVSYIEFTFLHDKEGIRYNKNSLNSNKIVLKKLKFSILSYFTTSLTCPLGGVKKGRNNANGCARNVRRIDT